MRKGEVWWADIGSTVGHEQSGRRPVVVYIEMAGIVVSVPLTTSMDRLKMDHTIVIYPDRINNLQTVSVTLPFHIRALDRSRLMNRIGLLSIDDMDGLDRSLKDMLALA